MELFSCPRRQIKGLVYNPYKHKTLSFFLGTVRPLSTTRGGPGSSQAATGLLRPPLRLSIACALLGEVSNNNKKKVYMHIIFIICFPI